VPGARARGKARSPRAHSMRTSESRLPQLMTVCGHGARVRPRSEAQRRRTRPTARQLMRALKKRCRERQTTSI
jgi:hypothetical protein